MENCSSDCLICCAPTCLSSSINSTKQQFHQQLQVIFVLRKILELPVHKLAYHLKSNWDIEHWICLCEKCDALVAQCRLVYDQLLKISKKFKSCQLDVIKILKENEIKNKSSVVADGRNGLNEFQDDEEKENRNFLKETRNFVTTHNYEHLVDPVEKMKALACRNKVKNETPQQTEEDLITDAIIKTELELENENCSIVDANSTEEIENHFFNNDDDASNEGEEEEEEAWEPDYNDKYGNSDGSDEENEKVVCRSSTDGYDKEKILKPDSETEEKAWEADDKDSNSDVSDEEKVVYRSSSDTKDKLKCLKADTKKSGKKRQLKEKVARKDQLTREKVFVCPFCKIYRRAITFEKCILVCNHLHKCRKRWGERKKLGDNQITELICRFCPNQSFSINNISGFVNHLVSCTRQTDSTPPSRFTIFQCNICVDQIYSFFTSDEFIRHYCYHSVLVYKCAECSDVFSSAEKDNLRSHWRNHHTDLLSSFDDTNAPLYIQLEAARCPSVPWWCPECGESFPGETQRDDHYKTRHPSNSLEQVKQEKCQFCEKLYCCSDELKLHQGTAHMLETNKLVQCDNCTDVFVDKSEVLQHRRRHHGLDLFVCPLCNQEFIAEHLLRVHHSNVHEQLFGIEKAASSERPALKCHICSKEFSTKKCLSGHIAAIHEKTANFVCDVCGKRCTFDSGLRVHRLKVHGRGKSAKKFVCPVVGCGKKYSLKNRLRVHVTTHGNTVMYPCTLCDEDFYTENDFKCHQRSAHAKTDVTPAAASDFRCDECPYRSKHNYILQAHKLKKHLESGKDNFKTKTCPKCKICSVTFNASGTLKRHLREAHGIGTKKKLKCQSTSVLNKNEEEGSSKIEIVESQAEPKVGCQIGGSAEERSNNEELGFAQQQSKSLPRKEQRPSKKDTSVVCHFCGKRYSNIHGLRKHVHEQHERVFKITCEHCGAGCTGRNSYLRHLAARHQTGEFYEKKEMFKCTVEGCDKIIFTIRERNRHIARHSGTREYKCKVCDWAFYCPQYLSQHEKLVHKAGVAYNNNGKTRRVPTGGKA